MDGPDDTPLDQLMDAVDQPYRSPQTDRLLGTGYLTVGEMGFLQQIATIFRQHAAASGRGIQYQARLALALAALMVRRDLDETQGWDEEAILAELRNAPLRDLLGIYAARDLNRRSAAPSQPSPASSGGGRAHPRAGGGAAATTPEGGEGVSWRVLNDDEIVVLVRELQEVAKDACEQRGGDVTSLLRVMLLAWIGLERGCRIGIIGEAQATAEMVALQRMTVNDVITRSNEFARRHGAQPLPKNFLAARRAPAGNA